MTAESSGSSEERRESETGPAFLQPAGNLLPSSFGLSSAREGLAVVLEGGVSEGGGGGSCRPLVLARLRRLDSDVNNSLIQPGFGEAAQFGLWMAEPVYCWLREKQGSVYSQWGPVEKNTVVGAQWGEGGGGALLAGMC